MKIMSTSFAADELLPAMYTCDGKDVNPSLRFEDVPPAAQSLVLIMDDPDVPPAVRADRMWDHWIVYNIPPATREVPEDTEPPGVHGTGTSGNTNYHGPCPPDREHRYFFKLYALDTMLTLPPGARKHEVEQAMQGRIIAEATLMGRYERQRK